MNKLPFYLLNPEKEKELFDNSIIVFDTSSLLDFYFFTDENIIELEEKLFKQIKSKLYFTFQSHFEFLKNKDKVKLKPIDSYNSLINKIKGNNDSGHIEEIENVIKQTSTIISDEIRGHLKTLQEKVTKNNKHPYLKSANFSEFNSQLHAFEKKITEFKSQFENFKKSIIEEIEDQKNIFKNVNQDKVLPILENYFNITKEHKLAEIFEYIKEGEFRYKNQIPPGYLDEEGKIGFQKYGDLIVWKEILTLAKSKKSNIILVINDVKEDWWHLDDKKKHISPRYELIKEFSDTTNKNFWMYDISNFLYKANNYISTSIDSETIEDIKNITEEKHPEFPEEIFIEWLFKNFNLTVLDFFKKTEDLNYDYVMHSENEKIIVKHCKIKSPVYTRVMMPIRDYINESHKDSEYSKTILILEYDDLQNLSKFDNHKSSKKTLRTLLRKCNAKSRIIVTLNIGEEYRIYWDSEK